MGYRIIYGKDIRRRYVVSKSKQVVAFMRIILCVGVVMALLLWPKGRLWAREVALPGDNSVTKEAVNQLIQGLEDGQELGEALQVFCQEILRNG